MKKLDIKKLFKVIQISVCIVFSVLNTLSEILNAEEKWIFPWNIHGNSLSEISLKNV